MRIEISGCVILTILLIVIIFYNHKYIVYKNNEYEMKIYGKRIEKVTPSIYFPFIRKNINCRNVYTRMMKRKAAKTWPPPKAPPSYLYYNFTQNGEMPITETLYFAQKYSGSNAEISKWTVSLIDDLIKIHKLKRKMKGGYSVYQEKLIDKAITKYSVNGKDVAVIGSSSPWVEAIIASKHPNSITTIEYGKINSTIPYLKTYVPDKFAEETLRKEIKFDFVISHSSMEHSGLGRYGDELNPDGDIHAAEEVWCMLKDGGFFLIGMPYNKKSFIRWNADRNYGPERMKYFAANFEQIEFFGKPWCGQNPLLLRKRLK